MNANAYTDHMRSRLIAAFLMAWLPLQGWAAVAMPFCKHAMRGKAVVVINLDHSAREGHAQYHDPTPPAQSNSDSGLACNDCGACHLACAPGMPSAGVVLSSPSNPAQ